MSGFDAKGHVVPHHYCKSVADVLRAKDAACFACGGRFIGKECDDIEWRDERKMLVGTCPRCKEDGVFTDIGDADIALLTYAFNLGLEANQ